ncbi:MAG: protein translocase subunit SecF [Elusimicrobiota bacterium]
MIKIIGKTNIDFISMRYKFFAFSALLIGLGVLSIFYKGVNLGLDFAGGTLVQIKFEDKTPISDLRQALKDSKVEASVQSYEGNSFGIRIKGSQENVNEAAEKILAAVAKLGKKFTEEKRDYVGPVVGKDMARKAIFAVILSLFGIIVYVAFRFSNPVLGTTGVIALAHDVLVALAFMSFTNREIDLVIVAALLTIAGYSINDTIVIYDRMRENIRKFPKMPMAQLINTSINETLSRTIFTSATVIGVLFILYLFGGSGLNDFSFCMLVGNICGVYSTIAIATPLAYEWQKGK